MVQSLTTSNQESHLENLKLTNQVFETQEKLEKYQLNVQQTILQLKEQLKSAETSKQQLHETNAQVEIEKQQLQHEVQQLRREIQRLQQAIDTRRTEDKQPHWVISNEEIQMTDEVIGTGGWGEVKVAKFRGLKVAAKCLHAIILSSYNLKLFTREMEIASRIRHPNLLQFVGATREGSPIILSELMPTSLRKELENGRPLTQPQVLKVSQDIAAALNYLHFWKPNPIIHRDVSSGNVLLERSGMNAQWKGKLSDYGSANIQQKISTKSISPGCPVYAAPESRFPDEHSPAMDIYSYGVLVTEMILGEQPGFTAFDREQQCEEIECQSFKDLVKKCIATEKKSRITIIKVMELVQNM